MKSLVTGLLLVSGVAVAGSVFYDQPQGSGGSSATFGASPSTGDCIRVDDNGVQGCTRTADAVPNAVMDIGQNAYSDAVTNTTGANLILSGGLGSRRIAMTAANCATDTITAMVDSTITIGTEGTTFACAALTNAQCATNVASWLNGLTGIAATANSPTSGTVSITKDLSEPGGYTVYIQTSDATCAAITNGDNGSVKVSGSFLQDQYAATSDTAPTGLVFLHSQGAYPGATVNTAPNDIYLVPGEYPKRLTVVTVTGLAGVTLTFHVNAATGQSTDPSKVLTMAAAPANENECLVGANINDTAASLAACINANSVLSPVVFASNDTGTAIVRLRAKPYKILYWVATSNAAKISTTMNDATGFLSHGFVRVAGALKIVTGNNTSEAAIPYFYGAASNIIGLYGGLKIHSSGNTITWSNNSSGGSADTGLGRNSAGVVKVLGASVPDGGLVGGSLNMAGVVKTTDALPGAVSLVGESAYSQATGGNRTGGHVYLYGGDPQMYFQFLLNTGALTLTFYNNAFTSLGTMVAGTNFNYGADVNDTATNLATAINATSGLNIYWTATAVTDKVYLQRKAGIQNLWYPTIATSDAAICTVNRTSSGNVYTNNVAFVDGSTTTPPVLTGYGTRLAMSGVGMLWTGSGATTTLPSNGQHRWASTTTGAGTADTGLARPGAGILNVTNGATTNYFNFDGLNKRIQTPDASGTDAAGNDLYLRAGPSTGVGANGIMRLQIGALPAGPVGTGAGTTVNGVYSSYLATSAHVALTAAGGAETVATITLPATKTMFGADLFVTITCGDGTDVVTHQSGTVRVAGAMKGTTMVCSVTEAAGIEANATTLGGASITDAWTTDVATASTCKVQTNIDVPGMTETYCYAVVQNRLNADAAAVVTMP